ncbi:MAG: RNA polymerase II-associated protein [Deltaproteobacteria bacterium]|jgi:hypothetical protein|nr:RNA polymerase II-associated protein [Deltaproteobacteria bacterium]
MSMDLICEKYLSKIDPKAVACKKPAEYCKFRTACMAHFIGSDKHMDIDQTSDAPGEALHRKAKSSPAVESINNKN